MTTLSNSNSTKDASLQITDITQIVLNTPIVGGLYLGARIESMGGQEQHHTQNLLKGLFLPLRLKYGATSLECWPPTLFLNTITFKDAKASSDRMHHLTIADTDFILKADSLCLTTLSNQITEEETRTILPEADGAAGKPTEVTVNSAIVGGCYLSARIESMY